MGNAPSSIIHLNLQTKAKRKTLKSDTIREEIARLERANGYIKGEPKQECYVLRNRKRIRNLKVALKKIESKGGINNG